MCALRLPPPPPVCAGGHRRAAATQSPQYVSTTPPPPARVPRVRARACALQGCDADILQLDVLGLVYTAGLDDAADADVDGAGEEDDANEDGD